MAAPLLNPDFPKAPCVKINSKKCALRNQRKFIDTVISEIFLKAGDKCSSKMDFIC